MVIPAEVVDSHKLTASDRLRLLSGLRATSPGVRVKPMGAPGRADVDRVDRVTLPSASALLQAGNVNEAGAAPDSTWMLPIEPILPYTVSESLPAACCACHANPSVHPLGVNVMLVPAVMSKRVLVFHQFAPASTPPIRSNMANE